MVISIAASNEYFSWMFSSDENQFALNKVDIFYICSYGFPNQMLKLSLCYMIYVDTFDIFVS